jgi:hypothetical protein
MYLAICVLVWGFRVLPESSSTESQAWVSGILLTVTSLPSIFLIAILGSELDTAHLLGKLQWIPTFGEIFPFLISQLVNAMLIFLATSIRRGALTNHSSRSHVKRAPAE